MTIADGSSVLPSVQRMAAIPVLPADEQRRLAAAYRRTRDPVLARRLVLSNLRLVAKIAREYRPTRETFADLVQEGNLGLMRAIERFDPRRGVKLSSYAGLWIRAFMLRFLMEQTHVVRLGTTRASRRDFLAGRRVPCDLSLNQPVKADGGDGDLTHQDLLSDDDSRPDHQVEEAELRARFALALGRFTAGLPARERRVFAARWLDERPATLKQVGRSLSLSGERVRQLERGLLHDLRATTIAALAA